ncbi:MAG: (2Fe-2S) ferredoxin domain-containing protein [bacterium]
MERNRHPLEELRQVAEDTLDEEDVAGEVSLKSTECLGPCSRGNTMGVAREGEGVYLFVGMNEPASMTELARAVADMTVTGQFEVPDTLSSNLEAKLSPESIPEIPFKE